jgi:hypothetical protein
MWGGLYGRRNRQPEVLNPWRAHAPPYITSINSIFKTNVGRPLRPPKLPKQGN